MMGHDCDWNGINNENASVRLADLPFEMHRTKPGYAGSHPLPRVTPFSGRFHWMRKLP